jgi:hypothetical protein
VLGSDVARMTAVLFYSGELTGQIIGVVRTDDEFRPFKRDSLWELTPSG